MKYLLLLILIFVSLNLLTCQEGFTNSVVSPDILEIIKKGKRAKIVFQESTRQSGGAKKSMTPSISNEKKYKIFYIDEENYKKSMINNSSDISLPPSSSSKNNKEYYESRLELYNYLKTQDSKFNLTKWKSKDISCSKNQCTVYLNDLDLDKYRIIILKKEDDKMSTIRKVIQFSEDKPYKLFNFPTGSEAEEENNSFGSLFKIPIPCNNFTNEIDCPDELVGTIMSRCYWDINLGQCRKTYEEEYLT